MEGEILPIQLLTFWVVNKPLDFFKGIHEMVMYWRARGINILPYLNDFLSLVMGYNAGCLLARIVEKDMHLVSLPINQDNIDGPHKHERLHLGFHMDLAAGLFKVSIARWTAFRDDVVARSKLASSHVWWAHLYL